MRVLVCGGRDYDDEPTIREALGSVPPGAVIVHGDARGADRLSGRVARDIGLEVEAHPADWRAHGRAAGPIRNREMADTDIDIVLAFPGGRGTADMVAVARSRGIPVVEVSA